LAVEQEIGKKHLADIQLCAGFRTSSILTARTNQL